MVPPGLRRPVASVTKRPVDAERVTVRLLLVPAPMRSVVVLPGQRAAVALLTNRPVDAERLADLAMGASQEVQPTVTVAVDEEPAKFVAANSTGASGRFDLPRERVGGPRVRSRQDFLDDFVVVGPCWERATI